MSYDEKEVSSRSLRYLLILEEMAKIGKSVTPTEVNKAIGLPKQTIHRVFSVLEQAGFIQKEIDAKTYSLSSRMRKMSLGVMSSVRMRSAQLSIMQGLSNKIGETVNLVIPDRLNMTYLDRIETNWSLKIDFTIGSAVPFHCTASGKLYLSSLPKARLKIVLQNIKLDKQTQNTITDIDELITQLDIIKKQGYSVDNQEFVNGMIALGAPVLDNNNRLIACLTFHFPVMRMSFDEAMGYLPDLNQAAEKLSSVLVSEYE